MVAWAAVAVTPTVVRAQATNPTPPPTATLPTCDCPEDDTRGGGLRDLAAFAPLGLLGALAAAGGTPGIFAAKAPAGVTPDRNVATAEPEVRITEPGRNTGMEKVPTGTSLNLGTVPDPVPPDSLRGGIRAPNTGTPLPSMFLLGSGLIAIGCVAVLRTRG